PDLTNCKVFVNGRTGKTTPQVENIKNFWYRFLYEAKAEISVYDYDASHELNTFFSSGKRISL
ncbi:MAG: hypothetical protein JXI43_00955, partial [Tissierellales bacterium]|nr:hypothetical protein [Tissierellales bacterium]